MKIFGLETTGSFTGDISGSVTSTGSFGFIRTADGFSVTEGSSGFTILTSTGHLMIGDGASTVQMQKDLIPDSNASQDLGSTSRAFGQIFAHTKVTGSAISTGSFAIGRIADRLGVGIHPAASNNIHIGGGANPARMQFTNTATGNTTADGVAFGLDPDNSRFYFWNYENYKY